MVDQHKLRPARSADIAAMSHCAARAYATVIGKLDGLPDVVTITESDLQGSVAHVVEFNEKLAGFLIAYEGRDVLKLANLAVDPDYQGKGIARLLLENIEDLARDMGLQRMDIVSHSKMTATLNMYEYLGWEKTGGKGAAIYLSKPV